MCKNGSISAGVILALRLCGFVIINSTIAYLTGGTGMKIYDVSQELLTSRVYDGDPSPRATLVKSTAAGEFYNLTEISMCVHNGTHIDAPRHFIDGGDGVDRIPLEKCVGYSLVLECDGDITGPAAGAMIERAIKLNAEAARRILIKGGAVLTPEGARVFVENNVALVGTESQSVGDEKAPMAVHLILLNAGTVLLEGLRLSHVPAGVYLLAAQPINIMDSDGSPARAILISDL